MFWMTWRQHRLTLASLAVVFLGLAGGYLLSGAAMRGSLSLEAVQKCFVGTPLTCPEWAGVISTDRNLRQTLLPVLPALVGVFLGAPLVSRELEQRTFRYAWTQAITPRHWLTSKVLLLGSAVTLLGAVFAAVYRWWFTPATTGAVTLYDWFDVFDQGVLSFPSACLFAFALGVLAGTLTRRVVLGMGSALVGFLAVFLPLAIWVRPNYLPTLRVDADSYYSQSGGWATDFVYLDRDGNEFGMWEALSRAGVTSTTSFGSEQEELLARAGFREMVDYHPGDRFWVFQLIEAGIFVALAAGCVALTFWLVRRRSV
ncbi:ABC-2 family transporter protein [Goodfellowiella coeruleoviolacea]|uniref:ABC-2 family transporter protein n=1 Tax=Goodfellowiella coeruleoviolacea TaxID=334858 RepID=A0AAE3GEK6_9PSEU|nr:ABC-2 family transporter protein [Goodfellowiella coeruleoviolacea]